MRNIDEESIYQAMIDTNYYGKKDNLEHYSWIIRLF